MKGLVIEDNGISRQLTDSEDEDDNAKNESDAESEEGQDETIFEQDISMEFRTGSQDRNSSPGEGNLFDRIKKLFPEFIQGNVVSCTKPT